MHMDVIGMTVATRCVIAHHDVGALLAEYLCDLLGHSVRSDRAEATNAATVETGVRIVEIHNAMYAEDLRRGGQLLRPRPRHVCDG